MASDVMSLFGMDPRVIQQNRLQKSADKASGMSSSFAIGHAGGSMLGAGIGNMLGYETPDMAQASRLQEGVSGLDLNTPQGLTEAASRLMANGDYAQAMALHTKARDMTLAATTATNLQQDRSLGKSSNVVVQQGTAADLATMTNATPAKQHSITEHFDGRVMDVTQGKTFATKAEWLDSISKLYGPAAAAAIVDDTKGDSNVEGLSPTEGGGAAEQAANEFDAELEAEISSNNPDDTDYSSVDKKAELVRLEDDMKDIYTYLFSGARRDTGDRSAKAKELLKIKDRLRKLGLTENAIERMSAGYRPEAVGP
tara:strand:+ start:4416 stop:5351 length:936 start_codon:yes stop_codon:yes gene_type:complete